MNGVGGQVPVKDITGVVGLDQDGNTATAVKTCQQGNTQANGNDVIKPATGLMAHLGMRIVEVAPERVVGELEIGEHLKTTTGAVHGGTLMAFADTIGAVGTSAMGLKTATLESKTNFFAAATAGKLRAESTALHKGRRTHVWQTRITDDSGRLLSLTIQTQMIL